MKYEFVLTDKMKEEMQENMNLYVVTADGWGEGYGAEIYLVGVFSDKKKAEEVRKEEGGKMTEVALDEIYPLKESDMFVDVYGNDKYLGGYVE